jgi:hypothetical protein
MLSQLRSNEAFSSAIHYGRRDEIRGDIAHGRVTLQNPRQTSWYESERITEAQV